MEYTNEHDIKGVTYLQERPSQGPSIRSVYEGLGEHLLWTRIGDVSSRSVIFFAIFRAL